MKLVLLIFRDNLFNLNHKVTFANSLFIFSHNNSIYEPEANKLVSSANNTYFKNSDTLHRSLIYNINKKGPRIDPCGTPHIILDKLEFVSLY